MNLTIYSDGASRGNPGISAIAFMILDEDGNVLKRQAKYLGIKTNNQAEYEAFISALNAAAQITHQMVHANWTASLLLNN